MEKGLWVDGLSKEQTNSDKVALCKTNKGFLYLQFIWY